MPKIINKTLPFFLYAVLTENKRHKLKIQVSCLKLLTKTGKKHWETKPGFSFLFSHHTHNNTTAKPVNRPKDWRMRLTGGGITREGPRHRMYCCLNRGWCTSPPMATCARHTCKKTYCATKQQPTPAIAHNITTPVITVRLPDDIQSLQLFIVKTCTPFSLPDLFLPTWTRFLPLLRLLPWICWTGL